jgi:hypothetical protein
VFNNLVKDLFKEAYDNRFKDFIREKITLAYYGAFLVGRKFNLNNQLNNSKLKLGRICDVRLQRKNLPPLPRLIQDLNIYPL